jgi:hypothetical protein
MLLEKITGLNSSLNRWEDWYPHVFRNTTIIPKKKKKGHMTLHFSLREYVKQNRRCTVSKCYSSCFIIHWLQLDHSKGKQCETSKNN